MRNLLAIMLSVIAISALADQPSLKIEHAWSRAAMAGREGVAYLTIINSGAPDRLIGVSTPVAADAEVHQTVDDHGVMEMRAVKSLPIGEGETVLLAPGGYHIMLVKLNRALKQGDSFPLTLSFAGAGPITTTATVERPGARMMGSAAPSQPVKMQMQGGTKQP